MPYSAQDARDLLIAATLSPDPVLYIDDRWLYETEASLEPAKAVALHDFSNDVIRAGEQVTIAGCSWGTKLAMDAATRLADEGISAEVVDLRILNPFDAKALVSSVEKTGRLVAVDASWKTCGIASEAITRVTEALDPAHWNARPSRVTLPDAPAPSSKALEDIYYPDVNTVIDHVKATLA